MSDAELNVSLATLLGWKDCDINRYQRPPLCLGDRPTWHKGKIVSYTVDQRIPNYCQDLNVICAAVAEKGLVGDSTYEDWLAGICDAGDASTYWWETSAYRGCVIHATARQRAEALYRTLQSLNPES